MFKRFIYSLALLISLIILLSCAEQYLIAPQQFHQYPQAKILSIILKDGRILELQRANIQGEKILYIDKNGSYLTIQIAEVAAIIIQ